MTDSSCKNENDDYSSLPLELWSSVIPFLHPREMLVMTYTSKNFIDFITYEDMVRSSVMTNIQLDSYLKLLENRAIYMPSKTRFLQLINSRRCEHCRSLDSKVTLDYLGLCYCTKCLEGHRALYSFITDPYVMNLMVADSRIAVSPGVYVVNVLEDNPMESEERCGPVITINAMKTILDQGISVTDFLKRVENLPDPKLVSRLRKVQRLSKGKLLWVDKKRPDMKTFVKEGMDIILNLVHQDWKSYLAYTFEDDGETLAFEYVGIGAIVEEALIPHGASKAKTVANHVNNCLNQFMTSGWNDFSFLSSDEENRAF